MKLLYFFDDHIKLHIMKGKKYCNPAGTGLIGEGLSCIRENDVNMYFYTKGDVTIAFDSGHLNFKGLASEFEKISIDPYKIKHVFLTHVDVDHAGGIDACGVNIFPNAEVYLGDSEKQYLSGKMYRTIKMGIKLKNCVSIREGYHLLKDAENLVIGDISITTIHTPGHTLGHMCYLVDDKILISGDCLAVNKNGGYSFFDLYTQFPDQNKASLRKLRNLLSERKLYAVCTGHSGVIKNLSNLFAHIDETATFSRKKPFDEFAPWDCSK